MRLLGALAGLAISFALPSFAQQKGVADSQSVMHKLSRHLRMVHAHDNHGQGDEHLAPGAGNIDWDRVLTELDRTGFGGGFHPRACGYGRHGAVAGRSQEEQALPS